MKYYGWKYVSVLQTDDTYSSLSQSFQGYASTAGIVVQNVITMQTISNQTLAVQNLNATMSAKLNPKINKIFALFGQPQYTIGMLYVAEKLGLTTANQVFLSTDATMQSSFPGQLMNATYAPSLGVAVGLLGTGPVVPSTLPVTQTFLNQWWNLSSTEYVLCVLLLCAL